LFKNVTETVIFYLLKFKNCIRFFRGLSNAASSTVAKRVLTFGSTDEAASFIFFTNSRLLITEVR
jgi:hypothetical protein